MLGGLSGFLSRRCQDLSPCVELVPEPEDSSPVLTWILGYFWSLPRVVSPPLELGGGNEAPLDVGGTLVLPLEWKRVCQGTS